MTNETLGIYRSCKKKHKVSKCNANDGQKLLKSVCEYNSHHL